MAWVSDNPVRTQHGAVLAGWYNMVQKYVRNTAASRWAFVCSLHARVSRSTSPHRKHTRPTRRGIDYTCFLFVLPRYILIRLQRFHYIM